MQPILPTFNFLSIPGFLLLSFDFHFIGLIFTEFVRKADLPCSRTASALSC